MKFLKRVNIFCFMKELNLISWNVNGIRAAINKGFIDNIKQLNPEILCLQETKAHPEQVDHQMKDLGYNYEYWNSAEKKGYSGTAIFSKIEPISIVRGIGHELDNEGRVITAEFDNFYVVTVYTPNSKRDLSRLDLRYTGWDKQFLSYCKQLEKKKSVIFCGDLNAAHKEIDVKNDKSNRTTAKKPGNAGFTDKEREGISNIIGENFIDSFRFFYPEEEKFTWWSYMGAARVKNVGWRIDYFFISDNLKENLKDAIIYDKVLGSDHCPIGIKLKF